MHGVFLFGPHPKLRCRKHFDAAPELKEATEQEWGEQFCLGSFSFSLTEANSNFAPENGWLEDDPVGITYFSATMLVSGSVAASFFL